MATDIRVQEYEIAEPRLFQRYGLEYRSHYFQLDNPRLRARVIEVGSGPPVLFVHGGGLPLLPVAHVYRDLARLSNETYHIGDPKAGDRAERRRPEAYCAASAVHLGRQRSVR
ncbi:MAG: hypothetical protein HY685_06430 [Chloroflexi bacterium]|nr:hypothetical protein [Chloroflexota bacterium]